MRRVFHSRLPWVLTVLAASCHAASSPSATSPSATSLAARPSASSTPSAQVLTEGPWIVFHSDPGGDSRLSLMRPDGSDLTLLTDTVAGYPFGDWSPDGSRIAFLSGSFGEGSLLVIDADGSGESRVADLEAISPAWSPDGTALAFEAVEGGIYTVGADGSGLTEVVDDGHGPAWSPDGTALAYFADIAGNVDIFVTDATGANRTRVTHDPADDVSPAWSPDGDWIAFVTERGGNTDLFVIDPDGGHERRLTTDRATDESFSWSPRGDRIVYVSYRHGAEPENVGLGDAEVFVVDLRSGGQRNLTRNPAWDGDPDWSPDGSRIVFTRRTDHAEIYVMRADGSGQAKLPGMSGDLVNDCCARWGP